MAEDPSELVQHLISEQAGFLTSVLNKIDAQFKDLSASNFHNLLLLLVECMGGLDSIQISSSSSQNHQLLGLFSRLERLYNKCRRLLLKNEKGANYADLLVQHKPAKDSYKKE